jgi:hypothetical protein
MYFSPATYLNWAADKFQLIGVDLTWGNGARSASNVLAITGTTTADEGSYNVVYHLRALGSTGTQQTVSPIGFFAQGANIGHTTTGGYVGANFLPTTSLSNYIVLSKTADVVYVVYPNPVHYRIKVSNTGVLDATLDQVVDQLPTSPGTPTYVAGSSTWDGIPVGDPVLSGTQLVWAGSYNLPADTTYELAFDLVMAPLVGDYSNTAWGYIGSTYLDRTLDSTDNSPSAWTVHQDFATPTITPTYTVSPTITPTWSASPTASPTFTDVPPGSTATNTPSVTPSSTASPSATPTPTASPSSTISPTFSFTHTRTRTPTRTYSPTATASPAGTATITPTRTASPSQTLSSTRTATESRTATPTPSVTLTATESTTFTPSQTYSASPTESPTFSPSPSFSASPTATVTPSATPSATATTSFSNTPSATPTASNTPSFTPTYTITTTFSDSPTPTQSATVTPTFTPVSAPALSKPYPNPFRPLKGQLLRMDLGVAVPGTVKVKAYNLAGEFVRLLLETTAPNGTLTIYWDGKNNQAETVASGTYLILAETPSGPVRALVAVLK